MKLIAIATASALLLLGTAHAQQARSPLTGGYAELGYTQFDISGGGSDAKPGALRGIAGYNIHPYFAVEGMLAFGIQDDGVSQTVATPGGPVTVNADVKLQHAIGLYVKPKLNITDALEVFGRVGYTRVSIEASASAPGVSVSADDSEGGFSYGLGTNFRFSPNVYVGLDYMRYLKKDGVTTDGITVGLGYRF